jgi:hypothetical protein
MPVHPHTQPQDPEHVDLNDPQATQWWCKVLGVTEEKLREAVREVGTGAHEVRAFVRK